MFEWVLNTPLINYDSVLTTKSRLSFKLLSFDFSLKETLTLLTMLAKHYTAKRKMISENIITDSVKKTCRIFNSFNFQQFSIFMNFHEYLQVLVIQRRFCQLQINFPVMASLFICKIARKANYEVRHVNPPCTYRKLCQSPKPKSCF